MPAGDSAGSAALPRRAAEGRSRWLQLINHRL